MTLLLLAIFSLAQPPCPKGFAFRDDGQCYLQNPYVNEVPVTGLQKGLYGKGPVLSPKKVELGRLLFFDPLLSKDKTRSCAGCHRPALSFSDGVAQPHGRNGNRLPRSTPTLWNLAFSKSFFWDGRSPSLEDQAKGPLFSPNEMGISSQTLRQRLRSNAVYRKLFRDAFGSKVDIGAASAIQAIGEFERSLVSLSSPYDRYVFGDWEALSKAEIRGLTLFRSFVTRCTECHTPPLFTNHEKAVLGVPGETEDVGAGQSEFKVPSLRNIALTAPYMHAGNFPSLIEVLRFYNRGGGRPKRFPLVHWHIREMHLSEPEMKDLELFLATLTDESLMPEIPSSVPSGLTLE